MEWISLKQKVSEFTKKNRYVCLVVLAGMVLMLLPESESVEKPQTQSTAEATKEDLQESLSQILSKISGAGKVEVLLTKAEEERIVFQTDQDITTTDTSDEQHSDTVLVSEGSQKESGLIQQVIPPVYRGAVVVCQGADNANITLSIVKAVMSATGLRSDCITVLKMK